MADVLSAQLQPDGQPGYFNSARSSLRRSPPSQTSLSQSASFALPRSTSLSSFNALRNNNHALSHHIEIPISSDNLDNMNDEFHLEDASPSDILESPFSEASSASSTSNSPLEVSLDPVVLPQRSFSYVDLHSNSYRSSTFSSHLKHDANDAFDGFADDDGNGYDDDDDTDDDDEDFGFSLKPSPKNTEISTSPKLRRSVLSSVGPRSKSSDNLVNSVLSYRKSPKSILHSREDPEPPPRCFSLNSFPHDQHHANPHSSSPNAEESETLGNNMRDQPALISEDDTAVRPEPSCHVDYLSYDWREEDIWSSWKHIVSKRKLYGERSRLENASWRTWAKHKYHLGTVPPESLNWLKDCDVTWLYGPLQTAANESAHHDSHTDESSDEHMHDRPTLASNPSSFVQKKPILKKRSASEVMLQKTLSASCLIKEAAAAIQAEQGIYWRRRERPFYGRTISDFVPASISSKPLSRDTTDVSSRSTSGLQTPDTAERKHIRFDDKVEQCIAVDVKEGDEEDDDDGFDDAWAYDHDSSDDDVVMMKRTKRNHYNNRRHSLDHGMPTGRRESKTIAMLPSTTLKDRTDSPDFPDHASSHSLFGGYRSPKLLSPSPSQETLKPNRESQETIRPTRSSTSMSMDSDGIDDTDILWEPTLSFALDEDLDLDTLNDFEPDDDDDDASTSSELYKAKEPSSSLKLPSRGTRSSPPPSSASLRRTPSGMLMPLEEIKNSKSEGGIFDKVVDTVNTAKDIAHVIWNVGWRK